MVDTSDNVTLLPTVSSVGGYTKTGAKVARRRPMSWRFHSTPIEFLCWIRVPRVWSDLTTQRISSWLFKKLRQLRILWWCNVGFAVEWPEDLSPGPGHGFPDWSWPNGTLDLAVLAGIIWGPSLSATRPPSDRLWSMIVIPGSRFHLTMNTICKSCY